MEGSSNLSAGFLDTEEILDLQLVNHHLQRIQGGDLHISHDALMQVFYTPTENGG